MTRHLITADMAIRSTKPKEKMFYRKLLATLILALVSNLAESEPTITIGSGSISCRQLLEGKNEAARKASTQAMVNWTQGFFVGITFSEHRDYGDGKLPDTLTIKAYMDKYCREHPLDDVISAARAFKIEIFGYSQGK